MGKIKDLGGASTNQPQGGWRPLPRPVDARQAAADMQAGNFDGVIKLLGARTAPDDIQTAQGHSALMACIAHDAVQVAQRLLDAGANPDRCLNSPQDSTYIGCVLRRLEPGFNQPMLALLLRAGADPGLPMSPSEPSPLAYAASHGLIGPATLLARARADPLAPGGSVGAEAACAVDLALLLPDFQKCPMLWALFPPPIDPRLMARAIDRFGPGDEAMANWLSQIWTSAPPP